MKIETAASKPAPATGLLHASLHRAYLGMVRTFTPSGKAACSFTRPGGALALQYMLLMPQSRDTWII